MNKQTKDDMGKTLSADITPLRNNVNFAKALKCVVLALGVLTGAVAISNTVTNDIVVATSEAELRISDKGLGLGIEVVGGGAAEVKLETRPGWRFRDGRTVVTLAKAPGETVTSPEATSEGSGAESSGEVPFGDGEDDKPEEDPKEEEDGTVEHVPPTISLKAEAPRVVAYSVNDGHASVSITLTATVDAEGFHCEMNSDGGVEDENSFLPISYEWAMCGAAIGMGSSSGNTYTFTAELVKGKDQKLSFSVIGKGCGYCGAEVDSDMATALVTIDVYELSIKRDDYLGLDRTDEGRANSRANAKEATALVDPSLSGSISCLWTDCGICSFVEPVDRQTAQYYAPDPDKASDAYLTEELTVAGTVTDGNGSASATCTTNFTVVKVDVGLDNWGEQMDEKNDTIIGSYVKRSGGLIGGYPDLARQAMTKIPVSVEIFPEDLPSEETISLDFADNNLIVNGDPEVAKTSYTVKDLKGQEFFLFDEGGAVGKKTVIAMHDESGAKDKIAYDVCCCTFTIYSDCNTTGSDDTKGQDGFDIIGHAFWKIDIDTEHRQLVPSRLREYVGKPYGFYGEHGVGYLSLEYGHYDSVTNNSRHTALHVWHIPFEGCLQGLERMYSLANDEEINWNFALFNCAHAAESVGHACGVPISCSVITAPYVVLKDIEKSNENYGETE